jgi:histidine triad (HIT) family protein
MDQCIFCKIIDGEIPSYTIFEDDEFKVILDTFPGAKGHTLILPKKHTKDVFSIDTDLLGRIQKLAGKVAKAVKETFNCDGVNILQNNGIAAGQTVFHYHIHIIPRFDEDGLKFGWKTQQYTMSEFESIKSEITSHM